MSFALALEHGKEGSVLDPRRSTIFFTSKRKRVRWSSMNL